MLAAGGAHLICVFPTAGMRVSLPLLPWRHG